jgi:hypothetical protein
MAWSSSSPKEKVEIDDPELLDEDSETEENAEPVDEGVEKKVFVKFTENDYPLRYYNNRQFSLDYFIYKVSNLIT